MASEMTKPFMFCLTLQTPSSVQLDLLIYFRFLVFFYFRMSSGCEFCCLAVLPNWFSVGSFHETDLELPTAN